MIKFNIASINCCSCTEGPYKRLVIWFQGCDIHCEGCCNPQYQPLVPNHILSLEDILSIISRAKYLYNIEGVTYSGGEPTLQQNLPVLTKEIHNIGLGVISFTGRNYQQVAYKLDGCDVVFDGAFLRQNLDEGRHILGSTNKRVLCLTDRYRDCIQDWIVSDQVIAEVNLTDSNIIINGDNI